MGGRRRVDEANTRRGAATIWREWSRQATELHRADAENREKTGDHFYKIDEERIITIREELVDDFYAIAQVQTDEIQKLLEGFEDDRLQLTLELEAYERVRVRRAKEQMKEE